MDKQQIEDFFKAIDGSLSFPVTVALTGAAAGSLMGRIRPSLDIDFAVFSPGKELSQDMWQELEQAINNAVKTTGIAAEYARDIDRWSMISLLDYADHLRFHKQIQKVKICFLAPEYWAIGKLGRFLDLDLQDILLVFTKEKPNAQKVAALWGKALKASVPSTASIEFKRRVEYFFKMHGAKIWGKPFDPQKAIRQFHEHAHIR